MSTFTYRNGEKAIFGQAVALGVMFNEMARRAALNMGEHLQATDTYMRLAMRAQGQCRATLQTLGGGHQKAKQGWRSSLEMAGIMPLQENARVKVNPIAATKNQKLNCE